MPTIPIYQDQAQPPESSQPFIQNPETVGRTEAAVSRGAAIVSKRLEEYQKERAVIDASNALSAFADEERVYMTGESKLEGEQAFGGQKRGYEFYEKSIEKHAGKLTGDAQKLFREKAMRYREHGLDKLATHEANQTQKAKQATFEKLTAETEQSIKSGATKEQVLEKIDTIQQNVRVLHPGVDTTDIELKLKNNLIGQFLVEQAGTNPRGIDRLLAEFSGNVDEKTKHAIKDFAEKVDIEASTEQNYALLKARNGNDFAKMLQDLPSLDMSEKARKALKTRVVDEFHTDKLLRDMRKKEGQDKTLNAVVDKYAAGDFAGVRKMILNDQNLEPHQREHWLDKLEAREKAVDSGKDNPFNKTDPEVRGRVLRAVMEHPESVQGHQIWQFHGAGLSTDAAKEVTHIWTQLKNEEIKGQKSQLKRASEVIDGWWKNEDLGSKYEKGLINREKLTNRMLQFIQENPDKDVFTDFIEPYSKELKAMKVDEAFEKFYRVQQPKNLFRAKVPSRTSKKEVDEDKFYTDWLGSNPFMEVK